MNDNGNFKNGGNVRNVDIVRNVRIYIKCNSFSEPQSDSIDLLFAPKTVVVVVHHQVGCLNLIGSVSVVV